MRKKLSFFLIAVGLLLTGAGGWEAYSAVRTPDTVPADISSRGGTEADLAQRDPNTKKAEGTPSDAGPSSGSKEKHREEENRAISPGETTLETARVTNGDGGGEQKDSSRPSGRSEGSSPSAPKGSVPQSTATISITGDRGVRILPATRVEIQQGDTVYDVLLRVTRQHGIQMEARGSGKTLYVEGINNLYEFDGGPESGWMYRVNGVFPNYSAGVYVVRNGERIEWLYTRNLGRDIGASF
ncbi:hypothetical protein GCM10007416_03160 [Kroppenstedtia guangzhouensis]|uniref:Transcobalamin-like C-terminal domain-containing protein n=1 Tax=Kroppenstedtia guangzhouensis TaxID=1274356 RepID=A0ABQ1G1P1_9BACL|nr:DUF4430 domain-containing protein [Kroppenstedtia guangzhouensis]GGA33798.1 hypothetical protein GCM10007416_03160 [Kroppenstedtia guangzhouensis]